MNSAVSVPAETDKRWMRAAIAQSRHAEGRTKSNPPVGCIILDKSGRLCAAAHTGCGGVPHAETQALVMADKSAEGGTVYVTLEPCCHVGRTGACTERLIAAQVAKVVVASIDPNPQVAGKGIKRLQQAGIVVETGLMCHEATVMNKIFFHYLMIY